MAGSSGFPPLALRSTHRQPLYPSIRVLATASVHDLPLPEAHPVP